MNRLLYILPLSVLLLTSCTDKQQPQQSSINNIPRYADAAADYSAKSQEATKSMAPEDLEIMKQSGESLALRLPDPGLKTGEPAPEFSLIDANGKHVALSSLLKQGPVVLVFYRGAWCPYCNMHLRVLNESLPEFNRLGAQLVAITPQKPDKSAAQLKKSGYPFVVLSSTLR